MKDAITLTNKDSKKYVKLTTVLKKIFTIIGLTKLY